MTDPRNDDMNILVPVEAKPRLDYLHRDGRVRRGLSHHPPPGSRIGGHGSAARLRWRPAAQARRRAIPRRPARPRPRTRWRARPSRTSSRSTTGPSTTPRPPTQKFEHLPAEKAAGLNINETYYSSNDELLAKLNAGAGGYDIIVPSQNAVAQLIQQGKLMALDESLLPNLKYLDPKFLKPSYDPTGQYHVIKDYGITMFFYNNKIITEQPKTMKDFYDLLNKYVSKGRTNILDGAEEVVPAGADGAGARSQHERLGRPRPGPHLPALRPQGRHDHQLVRLHQRRDRRQDHPGAGLERRRPEDRRRTQGPGRHHGRYPDGSNRRSGRTTGASRPTLRIRWRPTPGSTGCSRRAPRSPR